MLIFISEIYIIAFLIKLRVIYLFGFKVEFPKQVFSYLKIDFIHKKIPGNFEIFYNLF